MLPPFDESGNLPAGIHRCDFAELSARFGHGSPERDVEVRELEEMIAWARRAGVRRIIVNGSFVTAKVAPNDVDIVLLPGPDYPQDQVPLGDEAERRWPFLQVILAADDTDLETWATRDFGTDRLRRAKGVVEVIP